ncbi:hypothetical protein J2847_006744 [Azospirillum agricola]|uniref:hypothetical protein n=1 Tax=Azospirillum agricola TaxID=1720247 RepID=UPI001AE6D2DE|nr:hypothetical protein [Azospirillum agricola]MBP2233406.1 hypothetical protein [Azospirillum agricola]
MLINPQLPLPGYLYGLTLANNAASPNTVIDVSAGVASDGANAFLIQIPTVTSKTIQPSGAWSAGNGGNGLDTGSRASNTWYHVFLIRADSDGAGDILFSTSFASPTMPSGYTARRRIGSVRTDASANILGFSQIGDEFIWSNAAPDAISVTNVSTTSVLYALSVPPDVSVLARLRAYYYNSQATAQCVIRSPYENSSQNTTFVSGSGHSLSSKPSVYDASAELLVRTNSARQVAVIADRSGNSDFDIRTVGWFDDRGRSS